MEASTNFSMLTGQYLDLLDQDTFEITVKDKKFQCNIYGVRSSDVIRELLDNNPNLRRYEYTYEESSDYFQLICDFFNFKKIHITNQNMISLKNIAENLHINFVIKEVNKYIDSYEEIVQKTNPIDELFELLYKIDKLTVNSVNKSILNSIWVHSEENIKEFVAFLLQVIRSGYILQPYLAELIISLDESSNETNDLNLLKPFIVKQLISNFYKNQFYCCFVYRLSKSGIIPIDQIISQIISCDQYINRNISKYSYLHSEKYDSSYHKNVVIWFYAELKDNDKISPSDLLYGIDKKTISFLQFFDGDKIDLYKKIRDSFEPTNEIAKVILNDDVDKLQSIITKNNIKIESEKLPFHLFDLFCIDNSKSLLDYSAECGSIKCFKYLLLNHAKLNESTPGYAIYGRNIELIRIIGQNGKYNFFSNDPKKSGYTKYSYRSNASSLPKYFQFNDNKLLNPISISIMMHQYNLFDWIIEENFNKEIFNNNKLIELASFSVLSGNIHSFIQCVDRGLNLKNDINILKELIKISSELGYFRFTEMIICLYNDVISKLDLDESVVIFGNLAITKLFFGIKGLKLNYENLLIKSNKSEYNDISMFIIDSFYQPTSKNGILNVFSSSIHYKSSTLFNYLQNKFKLIDIKKRFDISSYDIKSLLKLCCTKQNHEVFCTLFQFYIQNSRVSDVTDLFFESCYSGSEEIVQYLLSINDTFFIDYSKTIEEYKKIFAGNWKIALLLINKVYDKIKMPLLQLFFNESVKAKNKNAFEMLLQKNIDDKSVLFKALTFHDINLVNTVLDHNSQPLFINQLSKNGTAICVAVKNNDLNIVKRLLSVPGINLNIRNSDGYTPLIQAIYDLNIEAVDIILNYYKDNAQSQMWQFEIAILILLDIVKGKIKKSIKNYEDKIVTILNNLANFNINLSCYDFISPVCQNNSINIVSKFLSIKDINVNFHDNKNGDTPLISAIKCKKLNLVNLLIDFPKTDINLSNFNNQTPLILAVEMNMSETVSAIINHQEFDPVESNIDYAFFICPNEKNILDLLISKTNINYQYNQSVISLETETPFSITDTTLTYAVNQKMDMKIDLIISHPKFDPIKSHLNEAIFNSTSDIEIFKKLFQINKDVNILSFDGNDLIDYILISKEYNLLQYIFSIPDIHIADSNICKQICNFLKMEDTLSIDFLKYLVQYDENHNNCIHFDKLLPNGKSFFTSIEYHNKKIGDIVQLLLDKGVDPNAPDSFNVYPLQHAILENSYSFVITLIKCQKINFNVKLNQNATYLHIAAKSEYNILKSILKLNIIDINSKDDSGLTPLDVAKNYKSYKNVQLIKKVIEKGLSEAIPSTNNENNENDENSENDDDKSPVDLLKKVYRYLCYLDQFSDTEFGEGDKLVKSFNNLSYRRYFIKKMNNTFNKMDLFKTPILLENLYDNNREFGIYSDYDIDINTIDIHSEDFFENIKKMFEYIIQIDSLISNGEINDINDRLTLLHKMNINTKYMVKLFVNFMNDDESMYKLLSKSEKI